MSFAKKKPFYLLSMGRCSPQRTCQGDISASFSVKPPTVNFPPKANFGFIPSSGCVTVNKAERVQVAFSPTFIGEFEVAVLWAIESSPEDLVLKLKVRKKPRKRLRCLGHCTKLTSRCWRSRQTLMCVLINGFWLGFLPTLIS